MSQRVEVPAVYQRTLSRTVYWHGRLRRGGRQITLVIYPAEADSGIWFHGVSAGRYTGAIAARWESTIKVHSTVVLGNRGGGTLHGATALLAALRALGIDNATIEVRHAEIPSSVEDFQSYIAVLSRVGTRVQAPPRKILRVQQEIRVSEGNRFAMLSPAGNFRLDLTVPGSEIEPNTPVITGTMISDAAEPHPATQNSSSAEGNARHIDADPGTLRLIDMVQLPRAVQAGMIDVLGHLSLVGVPLMGHFVGYCSNPGLHQALLRALMSRPAACSYTTLDWYLIDAQRRTQIIC